MLDEHANLNDLSQNNSDIGKTVMPIKNVIIVVVFICGLLVTYWTGRMNTQTDIALIKEKQESQAKSIDKRLDKIEAFVESSDVAVLKSDIQYIKNDIKEIKAMFLELVRNSRNGNRSNDQ